MAKTPHPPRHFRGDDDLKEIAALLSAAWTPWEAQTYFHLGDLYWRMCSAAWTENLRLWEDESGQLVAFTTFVPPDEFEFQIHPRRRGQGIVERILAWGEDQVREAAEASGRPSAPRTWASEHDTAWTDLLVSRGYRRDGACCPHLLRSLDRPIPVPLLPDGFRVRSMVGEGEVEARAEVHRQAFAPSPMTAERYCRLMALSGYRSDLDVVAVGPDGVFAAFCLCWMDEGSRTGLLEPVGTHPRFRGLGLGRAVVLEGLRRLEAHGCECAFVVTGQDNAAALRLYESCGFEVERRDYRYRPDT